MAQILLLEPDWPLAEIYRRALAGQGHSVVLCASAQAGILAADQRSPDLLIVELQLIEHSGIEFLYEFRSYPEWQAVPVILQSGLPFREVADSWELLQTQLQVRRYLYKPETSLRQLLSAVHRELLATHEAARH